MCLSLSLPTRAPSLPPHPPHPPSPQEEAALRERHFGGYELQSCSNYDLVWAEDGQDVERRPPGER